MKLAAPTLMRSFVLAAAMAVVGLPVMASANAQASAPYSSSEFTPGLSVESSSDVAGAHPERLVLRMTRPANECIPPFRITDKINGYPMQLCEEGRVQQNLKDWDISLPPGLLADVNATSTLCEPEYSQAGWYCPPESRIGRVKMWDRECYRDQDIWRGRNVDGCADLDGIGGSGSYEAPLKGSVYSTPPVADEQAHLVMIVGPETGPNPDNYPWLTRIDSSVLLRTADVSNWGIDTLTRDIPDAVPYSPVPGQPLFQASVYEAEITLDGTTGSERDHPLISNPTSCQPRDVRSSFVGYATNSGPDEDGKISLGSGTGLQVSDTASYPVSGCEGLSFAPSVDLALSPALPEQFPGISSTLVQQVGEQTLERVEVEIPTSFKVNTENRLAQCSADQAAARACPAEAKVGELVAESNLLPEAGDLAGPLRGDVFIGETTPTDIKLYVLLSGFVEATLSGGMTMAADGTSRVSFDLPEVPQQRIALTLFGGPDKALVKTPKHCGTHTLVASFTSHNGATHRQDVPIEIGCTDPTFDVYVSTRRPRAHPTVVLTARSSGLDSAEFDLSRLLRVGAKPSELKATRRYGTLTLTGTYGTRELKVKLRKRGSLGSLSFTATEAGKQVSTLSSFDTKLGKLSKQSLSKRERRSFGRHATRFALSSLPEGTTEVSLELNGSRDSILQNPRSCKSKSPRASGGRTQQLNFLAHLRATNGAKHVLKKTTPVRCVKRKHR